MSFCIELFCVVTLQYQILVRIAIAYFIIEKKKAAPQPWQAIAQRFCSIGSCGDDRMEFNKLIPELTVKDIKRTREFYLNILQFKIEYERVEDKFMFLSFEDSQFMFEELRDDGWNVAEMAYPFGRGVNFSIEVNDIDKVYQQLIRSQYPLFREMMLNKYESNGELIEQKEFLVQDPDGYLLRFTHE